MRRCGTVRTPLPTSTSPPAFRSWRKMTEASHFMELILQLALRDWTPTIFSKTSQPLSAIIRGSFLSQRVVLDGISRPEYSPPHEPDRLQNQWPTSMLGRFTRMAKFMPKAPMWFVALLCAATIAALAPFAVTKRHKSTKAFICDQCGIRLWVSSDELATSSRAAREQRTFEDTKLSRWFSAHISTNCQHSWRFNHSSGQTYLSFARQRLWKISSSAGSSPTPPLVFFSADDQARVESLLRHSPDECRTFIRARLQGKEDTDE